METSKSKKLYEKAQQLSPAGVHSPVRAFKSVGGTPIFFNRGKGSKLYDVDGNEYVDYCMCWGALALGHAYPAVVEAVQTQAALGTHYGTPTPLDVELSELILSALTPYEEIRFVNSGTEAVMTALRLARGVTGRDKIVKLDGAYHGHSDSLLVAAGSGLVTEGVLDSAGVTKGAAQDTLVIAPGNTKALDKVFAEQGSSIAAIILEPVMANNGLFELGKDYLQYCRDISKKHGALLIFDEVITGFRLAWGGAKAYYNIQPDIGTYGKIMGGGLPVGAIAASKAIMEHLAPIGKVYQAGTLSGNPIAMAAGIANLKGIQKTNYYEHVKKIGAYFDLKVQELQKKKPFGFRRVESLFWFSFGSAQAPGWPSEISSQAKPLYAEVFHSALKQGVYLAPSAYEVGFISAAHTEEDIDKLISVIEKI